MKLIILVVILIIILLLFYLSYRILGSSENDRIVLDDDIINSINEDEYVYRVNYDNYFGKTQHSGLQASVKMSKYLSSIHGCKFYIDTERNGEIKGKEKYEYQVKDDKIKQIENKYNDFLKSINCKNDYEIFVEIDDNLFCYHWIKNIYSDFYKLKRMIYTNVKGMCFHIAFDDYLFKDSYKCINDINTEEFNGYFDNNTIYKIVVVLRFVLNGKVKQYTYILNLSQTLVDSKSLKNDYNLMNTIICFYLNIILQIRSNYKEIPQPYFNEDNKTIVIPYSELKQKLFTRRLEHLVSINKDTIKEDELGIDYIIIVFKILIDGSLGKYGVNATKQVFNSKTKNKFDQCVKNFVNFNKSSKDKSIILFKWIQNLKKVYNFKPSTIELDTNIGTSCDCFIGLYKEIEECLTN